MKLPNKPSHIKSKLVYQQKVDQREAWYKLVVKIISWKDGLFEEGNNINKISAREWSAYFRGTKSQNTSITAQKVLFELKQTRLLIKKHGGFK